MTRLGDVLAVVDLDNHPEQTLDRAVWIARMLGRGLEILLCAHEGHTMLDGYAYSSESEVLRREILDVQDKILQGYSTRAEEAGLSVAASLLEQRPISDGVMARALESDPCVIVKSTRFHSVAERGVLLDTDWQLIRSSPYPLWLVKSESMSEKPVVLAAVDPTHAHDKPAALDRRIVEAARLIAESAAGEFHLLHTYQRLSAIGSAANRALTAAKLSIDEIDEQSRTHHAQALRRFAAEHAVGEDHTHQLPGRTHEILPVFARNKKADLVIMGALARWGLKRMAVGSTAERVLDHLPCDVLVVRANEYRIGG
ncbi:MAG: universal stress protein [Pseudomonadota bacterium]